MTGLSQTQYVLGLLTYRNPQTPIADFITADVLISAIISKDYDTVCFLYNVSGIVGSNDFGIWPLHAAAYVGYLDICQIFFASHEIAGLDVASTFSPLHFACFHANLEAIRFLITKGANVNAVGKYCYPHKDRRSTEILEVLDGSRYARPFEILNRQGRVGENPECVTPCAILLIHAGATPDEGTVSIAATSWEVTLLSELLGTGANPNGNNPLG
ncbi:hypothetical protein GGS24DRAFT_486305 [Hypoxylon argillaceum]|nr:hypothetical protein GGS24DRAFT_486305 [Hypoxylon argillaceum]